MIDEDDTWYEVVDMEKGFCIVDDHTAWREACREASSLARGSGHEHAVVKVCVTPDGDTHETLYRYNSKGKVIKP